MPQRTLRLNENEQHVLGIALECYIRLGLGQFSEIAQRLDLLQGKRLNQEQMEHVRQRCEEMEEFVWQDGSPWEVEDDETSLYTLVALGLEARLAGHSKGQRWAQQRIRQRARFEQIDHRET